MTGKAIFRAGIFSTLLILQTACISKAEVDTRMADAKAVHGIQSYKTAQFLVPFVKAGKVEEKVYYKHILQAADPHPMFNHPDAMIEAALHHLLKDFDKQQAAYKSLLEGNFDSKTLSGNYTIEQLNTAHVYVKRAVNIGRKDAIPLLGWLNTKIGGTP